LDDLPSLQGSKYLYLDFETTSGDPSLDALNTWRNCYIAGIAVTADDHKEAWYVPVGHNTGGNLPYEEVYKWLEEVINTCDTWVNQNVKYDMHVFSNNTGVEVTCKVLCTIAHAKIVDSDRMRYGLDHLSRDWLEKDISHHEAKMAPYIDKNKDYGWIPADIMGEYATDDVYTARELYHYLLQHMPEESKPCATTEDEVTMALYRIERSGMNINVLNTQVTQLQTLKRLTEIDEELEGLIGYPIRANSNKDCFDLLCINHGLSVISWTDTQEPSFDKHALKAYKQYPKAPIDVLDLMLEYRKLAIFNGTFLEPYLNKNIDGVLHPNYNQTVRTGRMSCRDPNMQQLMKWAKELIVPRDGHIIVTADYAQIEYRLIVHYIRDEEAIAAFHENPDIDYHQWVADMCGISRRPAKTVNFLMGFGGGKARLLGALSADPDLIASIEASSVEEFTRLAMARAEYVYHTYHSKLPNLRKVSKEAEMLCRSRGYVRNLYGRRRRLPSDYARKAFNTVNQSSAADMMKERLVALMKCGYEVIGAVHDEIIMTMPIEAYTDEVKMHIAEVLESPSVFVRVPIRVSVGSSTENWLEASESSLPVHWKSCTII
jgi:DNA polymerase-1